MEKFQIKTSINSKFGKDVWQSKFTKNGATNMTINSASSRLSLGVHLSLGTKHVKNSSTKSKFTDFSDNRLLQILNSPLDQPLYEIDNIPSPSVNNSSSISSTSSFDHTSDENVPPPDFIAYNNDEGYFHFVIETIILCIVCILLNTLFKFFCFFFSSYIQSYEKENIIAL